MFNPHDNDEQTLDTTPRVVVGVDGSAANRAAVRWAAQMAERSGLPLMLVHVVDESVRTSPYFTGEEIKAAASLALLPSVDDVSTEFPGVKVTPHSLYGHPARTLRRVATGAEMLVLGRRGRGGFTRMLLGSVSAAVGNHATIPTVVVAKDWDIAAHADEPIVVGFDGSPGSNAALRFAIETAYLLSAPVRVVHVWGQEPVFAAETTLAHGGLDGWRADAADLVRLATEPWRLKYPELEIHEATHQGHVSGSLTRESESAQAIVVGGHDANRLHALLVGSTTSNVLYHAHCPAIVVPEPADEGTF